MIEIISENTDITTNKVIEWLIDFGTDFKRFNREEYTELAIHISNDSCSIKTNKREFNAVWVRRGKLELIPLKIHKTPLLSVMRKEERPVMEFYEKFAKSNTSIIGSYQEESLNNKLYNLYIAKNSGLNIPDSLVTNLKNELLNFFKKKNKTITKCIFHPPVVKGEKMSFYGQGTRVVDKPIILQMAETFAPTLIQEYIEKRYEVRTFFFNDRFYSMAIFSQQNEKTSTDYRSYDEENPNRYIPFKLPSNILSCIKKFIQEKDINTGSIDFIVSPDNDFYFLEINPQGQMDWVSTSCNYQIEKDIAKELVNLNNTINDKN